MREFPTMKDLTYWIIILTLAVVVVTTWRVLDPEKLSAQLSLGGTILSIFLALIAIIFSFVQSASSSKQQEELTTKVIQLTESLQFLKEINQSLIKEFNEKSDELMKVHTLANDILTEMELSNSLGLKEKIENYEQEISKLNFQVGNTSILTELIVFGPNSLLNLLKKDLNNGEYNHIQIIWKLLFENGVRVDLSKVEEKLNILVEEKRLLMKKDKTGKYYKLNV